MTFHFYKYQGTGNDFIIADNRKNEYSALTTEQIHKLCDRRFGIGADGLMLLNEKRDFDFEMKYYNADGMPGSMCGNGGRSIVAFAKSLDLIKANAKFMAVDGIHSAKISENMVSLAMQDVKTIRSTDLGHEIYTGSPHLVVMVSDLRNLDVYAEGKRLRNLPLYASQGINVNFVQEFKDYYEVRTYERGVEDETYSCGTGVTAVALVMASLKNVKGDKLQKIQTKGGELMVSFHFNEEHKVFDQITLNGPAEFVFEGKISYSERLKKA